MRRRPVVALALAAACVAAPGAAGGSTPLDSGIRARVLVGPTCPVQRPNDPACDDKPYDARFRIYRLYRDGSRHLVVRVRSGPDGRFIVRLRPARYLIVTVGAGAIRLPSPPAPTRATVRAHRFTRVLLSFDSGIR